MPKGKFTKEQNTHIESFMPDFVKELERGVDGTGLTHWKQSMASNILDSPSSYPSIWIHHMSCFVTSFLPQTVVRKFTNYRNHIWLPSQPCSESALTNKKANPLLEFSSIRNGRQLFTEENAESLATASKQRVLDTGNKSHAAVYQTVLKEQWDSLTGEEQSGWNDRAELEAGNVVHQLLGDAEMMLFYAFRQPYTGDLLVGTIHGHCVDNQQNFGGTAEDLDIQYGQPWGEFAEDVKPPETLIKSSSYTSKTQTQYNCIEGSSIHTSKYAGTSGGGGGGEGRQTHTNPAPPVPAPAPPPNPGRTGGAFHVTDDDVSVAAG
ncbi:hypothetical protein B0H13DRAFT_1906697 [Mycena leptocephala]|nr:hypothetical protein B0H13DRAFT_1906697 [Mycena leptocephala]